MGSPFSDTTEVSQYMSPWTPGTQSSQGTQSPASTVYLQSVGNRNQHGATNYTPSRQATQGALVFLNGHSILSAQSSPWNPIPKVDMKQVFPQRPPSHLPHGVISTGRRRLGEQGPNFKITNDNVTSTSSTQRGIPCTPEPLRPFRQPTISRAVAGVPTPDDHQMVVRDTPTCSSQAVGLAHARRSTGSKEDDEAPLPQLHFLPLRFQDGITGCGDPTPALRDEISSLRTEGRPRFHPMSGLSGGHGQDPQKQLNTPLAAAIHNLSQGFSSNYAGDTNLIINRSENIPDSENCSLFLVNLPPDLTTHDLLGAIHDLGPTCRIYATHINPPEPGNHPGAAAKIVFLERDPAHAFYADVCRRGGLPVHGLVARVTWNRIKTGEKPHLVRSDVSRVLMIAGPPSFVNPQTLTAFFQRKLQFQIDRIITHVTGDEALGLDAVVEYRFGSFRCQAQAARMALQREMPHIRCEWAVDPLSPEGWKPFEYLNFAREI